jgi:cobalt/nickel transport system ATP-binding protein
MRTLLTLHEATAGYPGRRVLDSASLTMQQGERIALTGGNGTGKTTLLHVLVGLLPLETGSLEIAGRACADEAAFRRARRHVGLLFQDSDDQLFCSTVLEDTMFGPLNLGQSPREAEATARATLAQLGLTGYEDRLVHRLSGGEKRLAALATVLAMNPDILLLDEPTNGLDDHHAAMLTDIVRTLPQAMLIVSHDRNFLERVSTRALTLRAGRLLPALLHRHPHHHHHDHPHLHADGLDGDPHTHAHIPVEALDHATRDNLDR